ncbi:MAG TPA: response regulator [Planctomycetota bacterium]|nr:response regulator [Planctomycetota bacterium]
MAKALIVDDEADAREFVRAILESDDWEVEEAEDGEAGLAKVGETKPDLIVLDVQMPKKDGFAVFGELAKNPDARDVKVIMLTGVGEKMGIAFSADDMGEYLGKEPDAYVEKPIEPEAFKRIVKKVMGTT